MAFFHRGRLSLALSLRARVPTSVGRTYSSGPGQKRPSTWRRTLFFTTFFFAAGAAGAYFGLDQIKDQFPRKQIQDSKSKSKSAFSVNDTIVVFVLGGPGAGKGTQCEKIVRDFGFKHLSAGDLLREERERPGSEYGNLIETYIKNGQIVPMEITIALLEQAMRSSPTKRFLIDGFPRALDQGFKFEETVVPSSFVLYFECPEEAMEQRLLKRGQTSGRVDDNIESIRKRFATFKSTSFPVIEHYEKLGKVVKVSCLQPPDQVYSQVKAHLQAKLKEIGL